MYLQSPVAASLFWVKCLYLTMPFYLSLLGLSWLAMNGSNCAVYFCRWYSNGFFSFLTLRIYGDDFEPCYTIILFGRWREWLDRLKTKVRSMLFGQKFQRFIFPGGTYCIGNIVSSDPDCTRNIQGADDFTGRCIRVCSEVSVCRGTQIAATDYSSQSPLAT